MESLPNSLLTEINAVSRMDAPTLRARDGHFMSPLKLPTEMRKHR